MKLKTILEFFPTIQAVLSIFAGIAYLCYGEYARALYWLLAAAITLVVTFWIK